MDLNIDCQRAEMRPNHKYITLEIFGADIGEVLDNVSINDVIEHFGEAKLLGGMSIDEIKNYAEKH